MSLASLLSPSWKALIRATRECEGERKRRAREQPLIAIRREKERNATPFVPRSTTPDNFDIEAIARISREVPCSAVEEIPSSAPTDENI